MRVVTGDDIDEAAFPGRGDYAQASLALGGSLLMVQGSDI